MSSPSTKEPAPRRIDKPRVNGVKDALLWLLVAALAVFPFPWWW
jgi:hypothetical protein